MRKAKAGTAKQKPKLNGNRRHSPKIRTEAEARAFADHIEELRRWLATLSEKEHAKALKKITPEELFYINWFDTYDSYQQGGPLRELLEGTL